MWQTQPPGHLPRVQEGAAPASDRRREAEEVGNREDRETAEELAEADAMACQTSATGAEATAATTGAAAGDSREPAGENGVRADKGRRPEENHGRYPEGNSGRSGTGT